MPADLVTVIEGLALQRPAPTTAYVHRRITDVASAKGWLTPSYSTVRSIIAAIDPGLRTLALDGDTAYRDRYELVFRRTADGPNDQWQCDHTLLDLAVLLLTAATGRRVQRDGVRFNSTRYLSPVLAAYVGEQVTVRHDPRDAAEVRLYHQNQFLCRAIAPELAGQSVTLKQVQTARTARRKALKEQLGNRRSLVDALPADDRYLPDGLPATPPAAADEPRPTHHLRTYASD